MAFVKLKNKQRAHKNEILCFKLTKIFKDIRKSIAILDFLLLKCPPLKHYIPSLKLYFKKKKFLTTFVLLVQLAVLVV